MVIDLAECRGDGTSVETCVLDRICAHVFPTGGGRFHIRPVGSAPWVQVELGADGVPESIEFAWTGEEGTEFEVGLSCAPPVNYSLEDDAGELRRPTVDGGESPRTDDELLTLDESLRTIAEARRAFVAAEEEQMDGPLVFQHVLWLARAVSHLDAREPPSAESPGPEEALLEGALTSAVIVELLANTTIDRGHRYRHEPLGHRWPLAQVLFVLGGRDHEGVGHRSAALLMTLVAAPLYAGGAVDGADEPADWLTRVLGGLRPLPPSALEYLRAQLQTERAGFAVATLVENGTEDAVEALRGFVTSRGLPFDLRAALLRENIAAKRHLSEPLSVAERLLEGAVPRRLRSRLLEDLFGDWSDELPPDAQLGCPALARVNPEAAAALRRIGANLRGVPASTRRVVAAGLEELP